MKKTLIALAALMISVAAYGQGAVVFNNRVGTSVVAPVSRPNGAGAGAGVQAQLFLVGAGGALTPLTPATTFRTGSAAVEFFVNGVDVTIPTIAPGNPATLRMRAWEGAAGSSYDASLLRGQSNDITVTLGGGTLPPANLVGLTGFSLVVIPEPSTIALGLLGAAALLLRRRKA